VREAIGVQVGDTHAPRAIGPITQTDIVRFAGAGGDFNPLHHDPEFVKAAGFPGVITMGQMPAGMLAGWVSDWFGVEHLLEYEVRFLSPVFLGDVLTLSGVVTGLDEADGQVVALVELRVTRGKDAVIRGTAKAVVTSR
jgi:acyl dehydratase